MLRILLAFLFLFLLSGNFAFAQSKGSFLLYGNDTINRIDENGMKTGPWIYFWRDTFRQVITTISHDCYTGQKSRSHCKSSTKQDTIVRHTNKIIAQGNYIQDLKEGTWMFGEDSIKKYHLFLAFSHDTISRIVPILAYDDSSWNFGSALFEKGSWQFCHIDNKTGVYTDWIPWDDIREFLDVFCSYEQTNYPSKLTVR